MLIRKSIEGQPTNDRMDVAFPPLHVRDLDLILRYSTLKNQASPLYQSPSLTLNGRQTTLRSES